MSYLVTYSGVETQAEISPGIPVYWRTGEARWVDNNSIQFYLDNPSVFEVAIENTGAKPLRIKNSATYWRDMVGDLLGYRLNSVAGKANYDWDENAIAFESGGSISDAADRVNWNIEINHDNKVGSGIILYPHAHWFQGATTKYVLTLQYRLQREGQAKMTEWSSLTITASNGQDETTYPGSGTLNQKTYSPTPITIECGISDTLQFRLARTDSLGGTMLVYFFDLHGEYDGIGSEEITSKTA